MDQEILATLHLIHRALIVIVVCVGVITLTVLLRDFRK